MVPVPHNTTSKVNDRKEKVHFDGLEELLKRSFDDKTLSVIDYEATSLLPKGENYCSVLIKLDVTIKRTSATAEIWHLVAKTPSPKDNSLVDWSLVFKKELFMYAEIHPMYRELEKEAGIKERDLINAWPKYIGYRNSLNEDNEVDDYSAMLMENITTRGFYNMDRKIGLDVHHASKALTVLARYHALGIVMKQRRPKFSEKAIEQTLVSGRDLDFMDRCYNSILKTISKTSYLQKHLNIIKSSFERAREGKLFMVKPLEPWATISHGDFWVNNILFHKDEDGKVDDVKFVDFQMYQYTSLFTDLVYFFNGSLDAATQSSHLRDLIELYYNSFIETLDRMGCDTSPFTRESFDGELKEKAMDFLPFCLLAIKFFVFEVDDVDNEKSGRELGNAIFETGNNGIFEVKLKGLTEMYENMEWF